MERKALRASSTCTYPFCVRRKAETLGGWLIRFVTRRIVPRT